MVTDQRKEGRDVGWGGAEDVRAVFIANITRSIANQGGGAKKSD